ncbi:nucleotide sugar dehydrogenase [Candidatus Pelagibacter sp. HIMB1748]|uniref:nucleotide sugar dehydrogenase n=1 Tax=unclassified Candidatus Pelagibacter TaxID=2647897 RepID=UPI003F831B36
MKKHRKLGLKKNSRKVIGVIGAGYVGLPLAVNLSKYFKVIAYDKNNKRIIDLKKGIDTNREFNNKELKIKKINYTSDYKNLKQCNVFIITLPTPLNNKKLPDISLVINATKNLSKIIHKGSLIIYESTFYPGTVEDYLIPILENVSKLKCNKDFFVGYSPERINPGDKVHTFSNVVKVVSGSNKKTLKKVKEIYSKVVKAGVFEASNIKAAELSKILENTQRFINIALMNNISTLCNKMKINTKEVIDIASTKWNFNKFYPGYVGGHCVAVDPLYLTYKQRKLRVSSDFIQEAERINSSKHIEVVNKLKKIYSKYKKFKLLMLGVTFKENCPDLRNSGSLNLIKELNKSKIKPFIHDPYLKKDDLKNLKKFKFEFLPTIKKNSYDCIILTVPHNYYKKLGVNRIKSISRNKNCLIFDLKSVFKKESVNYQM